MASRKKGMRCYNCISAEFNIFVCRGCREEKKSCCQISGEGGFCLRCRDTIQRLKVELDYQEEG